MHHRACVFHQLLNKVNVKCNLHVMFKELYTGRSKASKSKYKNLTRHALKLMQFILKAKQSAQTYRFL